MIVLFIHVNLIYSDVQYVNNYNYIIYLSIQIKRTTYIMCMLYTLIVLSKYLLTTINVPINTEKCIYNIILDKNHLSVVLICQHIICTHIENYFYEIKF